jgi:teichuronic acid biosynthesis glycosyltransferase TuaH
MALYVDQTGSQAMTGYDIIMLALPRWDGLYSSAAFSLARELSRDTRVFYIDNPFTYKDFLTAGSSAQIQRRKQALLSGENPFAVPDAAFPNLVAVTPRLIFPINWLPAGAIYNAMARVNDRIVYQVIDKLVREYGIKRFVFINSFNPLIGRFFPPVFQPEITVYHCVDDISRSEYVARHGTYLEEQLIERSDFTVVTSLELKRLKSSLSESVFYLPNAADVNLFQRSLESTLNPPPELAGIPQGKQIIFYMGNICQRLDYELLRKIAGIQKYHLVMVGPQTNDNFRKAGLDKLHNVTFTDRKDLRDLPSYLKYADCCIIPFALTPLTKAIYPLKINEYLSAGKPVVTTDFSEDIINFAEVAFVSRSHEEFIQNLSKALESDSEEKRQKRMIFSAANNWPARALELRQLIDKKMN